MGAVGEVVRQCRINAGMTQEQLAERAGLSVRGLRKLECGASSKPQSATLRRLADAFGIPVGGDQGRYALVIAYPFADGLAQFLTTFASATFTVAGTTDDGATVAALVGRLDADIAVVDIALGVEAIRLIRPRTRVLAVSHDRDSDLGAAALRAGATGFVRSTGEPKDLLAPLLTIAAGRRVVPTDLLDRLLS